MMYHVVNIIGAIHLIILSTITIPYAETPKNHGDKAIIVKSWTPSLVMVDSFPMIPNFSKSSTCRSIRKHDQEISSIINRISLQQTNQIYAQKFLFRSRYDHYYRYYRKYATSTSLSLSSKKEKNDSTTNDIAYETKFGFQQRIASIQSFIVGAIVGSISTTPIIFIHTMLFIDNTNMNHLGQWEYETDATAILCGLFAIIYRYCIRQDDTNNPQLQQGYISAMILIRTLPQITIPSYCTAIPLQCDPNALLFLFDSTIIQQLFWYGLESTVMFTCTSMAMDMLMNKGYIVRFPN